MDSTSRSEILEDLVRLDPDLGIKPYWGERSVFYNPGEAAPLGVIFASVKDHDGENDRSSELFGELMPHPCRYSRHSATSTSASSR